MDVRRRASGIACFSLLVVLLAPAAARAADPVEKVTALNKKALDEFKKRDYDSARALLKEALEICNSSGLDTHPIKARTHIHLGVVSIVGFKERDLGIKHFRKALDIQPEIKITKTLVTRDLQGAFEEAVLAGGDSGGGAPAGGGPPDEGGAGEGGGGSQASGDDDDGASKRSAHARKPPPKKKKADDEEGGGDEGGGGDDDEEGDGAPYHLYVALAAGGGVGLASGKGDIDPSHMLAGSGFAVAQAFQISPEIGYFFKPNLMLSARIRYQYVTGLTGKAGAGCSGGFCDAGTYAVSALARASIFLGTGSTRLFVGGEAGVGYISHAVKFPMDTTCKTSATSTRMSQCVDSLSGGPVLVGGVIGLLIDFSHTIGLVVTVIPDIAFPKFTFNIDGQIGLALHF